MKKIDWLKLFKISIGCCFAVFAANWLGLKSATSAGIITLLSIQGTKKDTLRMAGKRICAFFIAVPVAYLLFIFLGYQLLSFGLFLFIFTFACYALKLDTGVSMSTVLITHFWSAQNFQVELIINEFLLLCIGVGIAVALNLYMPGVLKEIKADQRMIDNRMMQILRSMSGALQGNPLHDLESEFHTLEKTLDQAMDRAYQNMNNTLTADMRYYVQFVELRINQCGLLKRISYHIAKIKFFPEQALTLSKLIDQIAATFQDYNNADALLFTLSQLRACYQKSPLPASREEFEARAVLFQIAAELEYLILAKKKFAQGLTSWQINYFWKTKSR